MDIYRKDSDMFWKRIGVGILVGSGLFVGWLAYGFCSWMLGTFSWNGQIGGFVFLAFSFMVAMLINWGCRK